MYDYILNPSRELKRALKMSTEYDYGMLGMALEILTVIKTIEELPVIDQGARSETVSVLYTLLSDLELLEVAEDAYARLAEVRRVRFVAEPEVEQPQRDAVVPPLAGRDAALASLLAAQHQTLQAPDSADAQPGSDRKTDPPSDGSA